MQCYKFLFCKLILNVLLKKRGDNLLNKEYIEAILKLLNAENDTFDGNFYSFSYFPKNTKTEDIDYNAPRPTYTITGNETIKKYNDLYNGLYKSIVEKKE